MLPVLKISTALGDHHFHSAGRVLGGCELDVLVPKISCNKEVCTAKVSKCYVNDAGKCGVILLKGQIDEIFFHLLRRYK